jgi:cephalosporin-C deacetylase-like acetyl esterase
VHTEINRPPSRQKIAAQDLWDGGSSRVGSLNELHGVVTGVVEGDLRAINDPKNDGFTDIEYNNSPTFMIKVILDLKATLFYVSKLTTVSNSLYIV